MSTSPLNRKDRRYEVGEVYRHGRSPATISIAVIDGKSKVIMECIPGTKAATILEFIQGLHGTLSVTFEKGISAARLHDLLKPHVSHLMVCYPERTPC